MRSEMRRLCVVLAMKHIFVLFIFWKWHAMLNEKYRCNAFLFSFVRMLIVAAVVYWYFELLQIDFRGTLASRSNWPPSPSPPRYWGFTYHFLPLKVPIVWFRCCRTIVNRCGLAVRRSAGKQKGLGSIRFGSPFSSLQKLWFTDTVLWLCRHN